ncbi:hypothetical protein FJTKL_04155 [Diaporthe vaccinii]|uniref:Uncharacterized protein n=2 Tax=Diaporthe vaccinii TaxID=105482 RepID=A0ABR4DTK9_9PEZI
MIIVVSPPDVAVTAEEPNFARYQDWADDGECTASDANIDEDLGFEPAFLHYTSGTTSSPKGVLSSQQSWLWSANSFASAFGLTEEDQFFWPLPLFHCLGHALCIIATVAVGASAHLPDPNDTLFDSIFTKQALTATIIVGAPASYHEIVAAAFTSKASLALPGLRACMVAGSSTPAGLSAQVQELFGVPLLNNYGCTEACGAIAVNRPGDLYREDSVGTIVPGTEVQLMDSNGQKVDEGEQGEVWIRSPGLMIRYHKETETPFTAEGWFPTGDIARRSKTGSSLTLVGRKKELIVRGGENVQPGELERALLRCPGVADVAVAGITHRLLGETPAAFIVRERSDVAPARGNTVDLDPSSLLATCRKLLPEYKVPTAFYEIDAVPRTLLGKPRRSAVSSCTSRPLTARSKLLSRDSIEILVLTETASACVIDIAPGEPDSGWLHRHSDQPFALLGLTSLAGVVLRDRLASLTGLDLPTTLVFDYPTPEAVSAYLYRRLFAPETPSPLPTPTPGSSTAASGVEPIAIVSMACRYPGGISSPEDLWRIVSDGVDVTSEFPDDRGWNLDTLYNPDPDAPGTSTTRRGAFLENMADFDAGLFGMSPREALATDPQQRLLLETTWELAERGGIAPSSLRGSQTGVFVGIMYGDYEDNGKDNHELEAYIGLGSSGSVVSGRVSYCFGLHGPSICIHTGCSSSLVAVHLAAASLRSGESSLAVAGGVTTMATPNSFISFSKRRGLSADGRCRAYSSDADGTGWSEGVGLVLLERLQDARRNGHHVLGVIRGSAVNSDGASNGLTAPSGPAQQQVIQTALAQAGLSPADVDVVEGHGTATPLGDPIEVQALISTYGNGGDGTRRPDSRPLLLGSVKSNIGHTQAAAGVAGLIKMVHAIQNGVAPASLHITEPSRHIEWEGSGVELVTNAKQWPVIPCEGDDIPRPRRAAVSSFGIGGTNAHVILEQPAEQENGPTGGFFGNPTPPATPIKGSWTFPWLLSGADEAALRAQAHALLASKTVCSQDPPDVALSLATTRSALRYKAAVTPALGGNYEAALWALAQGQPHPDVVTGFSNGQASSTKPRLAFLFSGQGARLPGRAALEELCTAFPVFADALRRACDELDAHLGLPLNSVLKKNEGSDSSAHLDRTDFAQAFLFAFEVAMFRLLESFNIRPDFVTGHSLGEIAAAHASGALSLREAATIVTARGKLMAALPSNGTMVSISASEQEVAEELLRHKHEFPGGPSTIAAVNSPSSVVVSGTTEAVKAVADKFAGLGRRVTPLRGVRHAFHSPMMDPMLADLEAELTSLMEGVRRATIPLVSSVSGSRAEASQLRSTVHWTRHVRQPVRFADAVRKLQKEGVSTFVEVGPSAVLSAHVPGSIATSSQVNKLLDTLGQLWVQGVQADWRAVFRGTEANRVDLPVYAFQRQRYWLDPPKPATVQPEDAGSLGHGILLHATSIPGTSKIICSGHLSVTRQPWLRDHVVGGQTIVPAAALTELALRAGRECTQTDESMVLEEFTFVAPLILDPKEDAGLQIQVLMGEPEGHGSRSVEIYSRPKDAPTRHEWTRNATGTLKLASLSNTGGDELINNTESIGDGNGYEDDGQLADVSRAYGALASAGISYGTSFQRVRSVWRPHPEGQNNSELRAYLDPPRAQKQVYALHPALLDAALHAPLLAAPDAAAGKIRLPFLLRGVRISAASGTGAVMARIRELGEDRFSVTLTDKSTGALVAEVSEVVTRAWTGPPAAGSTTGDLYRLEWIESAHINTSGGSIKPSGQTDELYRVRGVRGDGGKIKKGMIENDVHEAVAEVLDVTRKWSAEKAYAGGRLVVVTENATVDANADLVSAAVWGFVRSAQAELSGGRIVLVDLDGSNESEAALLPALASGEEALAIRKGTLLIPRLSKVAIASNQALISAKTSASTSTLEVSGTVLITGATGGLGALLSQHITRVYGAKHLLMVSRSGMKAPGAPKLLDELSSAGVAVQIEECDCSDRKQLATLFANNNSQGRPPISAIIHCAGVVDDAFLSSQSPERVSRVLRPKVDAAWHLHELAPPTVRSFVLFSSFAGILGNEGQAAYTAGNAFLDALARFRLSRGLPALSLAWGPWLNEVGMAAENRLKAHNPRLGSAKPFTDQQGLHLFDMAMQTSTPPRPVMAPLLVDGPLPLMSAGTGTASRTKASSQGGTGKWRAKLAKLPPEKCDNELLNLVRGEVAAVLGYQDQNLPDRPLSDLGFDSSTSVLLSNRLRRFTGLLDLPVTLALDYETLPALVQYLSGRLDITRLGVEPQTEARVQGASTEGDIATVSLGQASGEHDKGQKFNALHTACPERDTEHDHVDTEAFRGVTALYKRLCQLKQYTAAGGLLGCASLALPRFKVGSNMASYAAAPQRLAAGPSGPSSLHLPLVFLPSFLPPIVAQGFRGSAYSALASEMRGERDVFELPHPEGLAVPEDLEAIAAVHVSTIQERFGGPVVLAGYSAGGIIAHAVASRLSEEAGSEEGSRARLAGLVLIDTYLNMAGREDPEWLNALPAEALTARDGGLLHMIGDSDLALAKVGGYFRTLQGFKLRPLPDALPTLFLRAQYPTSNMPKSEGEWRPSWPQADVTVDIPGSHLELLDKRCAPASAAEIRQWIWRCVV